MVAPSFKEMPIVSEVFDKNGKPYVKVKNEKTGTVREVRWYSETEYAKNYGKKLAETAKDGWDNLKQIRGFEKGPILVIRGVRTVEDEQWCEQSCARYAVGIGWHIVSTDSFPEDAPAHFKYILLGWNEFKSYDDRHMKSPNELAEILNTKIRNKEFINMWKEDK